MNQTRKNNDKDNDSKKNNENSNGKKESDNKNEGSKKTKPKPLNNDVSSPRSNTPKRYSNQLEYNERGDCNIVSFTYGNTTKSGGTISLQQRHEIPSLIPFTPDSNTTILQQQQQQEEEEGEEPSRLESMATTATTTPTSADATTSITLLARQIQMLGTVLGISVILFLFLLIPSLGASIALGLCGISTLLLGQSILQYGTLYVQTELSHLVQDRGIVSYLPSTLQQYLTTTTFHEYMQDGTFLRDHYYFLLYFLPGLSSDQQAQFIQQLPSRHRDLLYHPGFLSLILPPSTHPWVFGNASTQQQHQQRQQQQSQTQGPAHQPMILMDSTTIPSMNHHTSGPLLDASSTPISAGDHVSYNEALRAILRSFVSWMEWIILPTSTTSSTNEVDENMLLLPTNPIGEQNLQLQQVPPPDMVWTLAADSDDDEDDEDEMMLLRPNAAPTILMPTSNDSNTIQQQDREEDTNSHQHEEHEDDYVLEEQIVNNAIATAIANITSSVSTSITTYVSTTIISTLDHWIPIVTRIGMVSSVAWGGLAFVVRPMLLSNPYILSSTATRRNNTMYTLRNTFASNSGIMLWTIGLFSTSMIGSAATMMILRSNARTAYREAQTKKTAESTPANL
jgi:hypothetical protein